MWFIHQSYNATLLQRGMMDFENARRTLSQNKTNTFFKVMGMWRKPRKRHTRLNTKEGHLYRLSRQRDRAGKDVLQIGSIKDGDGNVLTSEESVLRRWREYFEQLINKENERERRLDDVELVKQEVNRIMVMDRLPDEVRQESPWTMMFADDIVICGESSEQVEKSLERWRYALKRRGIKVSRRAAPDAPKPTQARRAGALRGRPLQSTRDKGGPVSIAAELGRIGRGPRRSSVLGRDPERTSGPREGRKLRPGDVHGGDLRPSDVHGGDRGPSDALGGDKGPSDVHGGDQGPSDVHGGDQGPSDVHGGDQGPSDVPGGDQGPSDVHGGDQGPERRPRRRPGTQRHPQQEVEPQRHPHHTDERGIRSGAQQIIKGAQQIIEDHTDERGIRSGAQQIIEGAQQIIKGLPLNAIRPLQMIQNAAARLVFNQPKFSHTTPLLRSLHWLPCTYRIRFKTLMLAYKAKNGPAPSYLYLSDFITSRTAPRCLRSSSTARLVPPSLRMRETHLRTFLATEPDHEDNQPKNLAMKYHKRVQSTQCEWLFPSKTVSAHFSSLYRLARQRDRAGKDVLQVGAIKDGDGNVLTSEESVLRRWREYFEQLMNEENERERRLGGVKLVKKEVDRISKEEDVVEQMFLSDISNASLRLNRQSEMPTHCMMADEDFLPFQENTSDLVVSNLSLHWINDVPGALRQVHRVLKPDGVFVGAMVGGVTLYELFPAAHRVGRVGHAHCFQCARIQITDSLFFIATFIVLT
ncbi:arginine-hydroxylase NDUFAF5, mitochondrial precursor [Silurus meridionalis]|nr:arginine-hydroxylase NDUFAF5, mitochondrial precursor [Silurus meridionalis]